MQKWWLCIPLALGISGLARAQDVETPAFNAQSYRAPIDSRMTLWTDDSGLAPDNSWSARLSLGYAKHLLSVTSGATGETQFLVDDLMQMDVIAGYTLGRVRMGLDVPVFPMVTSELRDSQTGLGDLAFDLRGTLIEAGDSPIGVALATRITAPTATIDLPLGSGGLGYEASGIVDFRVEQVLLALNLGYRGVPAAELDDFTVDDQAVTRLGIGVPVGNGFGVSADLAGNVQLNQDLGNVANGAWEGLAGFWLRMNRDWVLRAGSGGGITSGIGTPMLRSVVVLGFEPEADLDTDGDGYLDSRDKCPDRAEDLDGWEDDDGCPDEKSPVRILMRDPYGNPVDEAIVQITTEAGEPIEDGGAQFTIGLQPDIYGIKVRAEGYDDIDEEFVVEQGKALDMIMAMNPTNPAPPVRVTKKAIRINDKVYFETNKDVLKAESHRILNLVAKTMKSHPEIERIRVVGHTDSRADDGYNQDLSERRAKSVMKYLIGQGVSADRLEAVGKGETAPLDLRDNESAWELNRRVEFVIVKRK